MRKVIPLMSAALLFICATTSNAQRYEEEVFDYDELVIQTDLTYGTNIDFLTSDFSDNGQTQADLTEIQTAIAMGDPIPAEYYNPADANTNVKVTDIKYDLYMPDPSIDDETERPVIIYVHTGNFLPPIINGGITGSKNDSAAVNLCRQWAKRGFVAISMDYRKGWNPISPDPDVRRGTLLNAVYRAIQDNKQLVRVLREDADNGNPNAIDTDKIALYGQGSGGYVTCAYMSLDQEAELNLDKFIDSNTGMSYVNTAQVGEIDGLGGALNLYQDNGYTSEIQFSANAGGALADNSWLQGGENPHVALHCVRDPFAPFGTGDVIVPTTNEIVVEVDGSNVFVQEMNDLGNNDVFASFPNDDPYTQRARSLYGETVDYIYPAPNDEITINSTPEGLYPFILPINETNVFLNEGHPWDWWDLATLEAYVDQLNAATGSDYNAMQLHQQGLAGNPVMGPDKGLAYIDTIQGYMIPRLMLSMDIPLSLEETEKEAYGVTVYPNPTIDQLTITCEGLMEEMVIYNTLGAVVAREKLSSTRSKQISVADLESGLYTVRIKAGDEFISRKFLKK
jgi:hypothetical protein